MGVGSLFNHSRDPNMDYRITREAAGVGSAASSKTHQSGTIFMSYFTGLRAIDPGEELCIFYGPDEKLWFEYPKDPGMEEDDGSDSPEAWLGAIACQSDDDGDSNGIPES